LYGTPTLRFQIQAYNNGTYISNMSFATTAELGVTDINGWQTAKITLTTPANCNRILWFVQDGDDYTAYTHGFNLANAQCEQQSFATLFCYPARSNTQALLDVTNNNVITATSLVYASNNTFTFAGGINYCSVSNLDSLIGDVTLEAVVNLATANGPHQTAICTDLNYRYGIKLLASYHGSMAAWAGFGATDYLISGSSIQNTGNAVIALTRTSSTGIINLYLNGSLVATGTGSTGNMSSAGSCQGRIGIEYHSGSYGFNGSIFTAKAYNTALTATEVFNNFSALRGRYGI
jgi:hypothetical protein